MPLNRVEGYNSVVWVWVVLKGGGELGLLRWVMSVGMFDVFGKYYNDG
jgi:hypothetical protein